MEVKILVNTNRSRDFVAKEPVTVDRLELADKVFLPVISLGELRAGFICGTAARSNEAVLTQFLNKPRVAVLHADDNTTHHYARLFYQLRKQGTPIPTNDMWIAALAVQHDLFLFSRDAHFDHLPQLARVH